MWRDWMRTVSLSAGILVATLGLSACQTIQTTQGGAVGVDRQQFSMVSAKEVEQASAKAYSEIIAKAQAEGKLNTNPAQTRRVVAIANRMIPQTSAFRADAPNWRWEVNVLQNDQLNAWCMAGGKIAFYSGLIDKLQLTDDEIAAIMGHEIAHALREHSRERMSQAMATNLGVSVLSIGLGLGQLGKDVTGMAADVAFGKRFSREHETEADRMGVELAARAGYDPRASMSLWTKMAAQTGGGGPQWLSTHPSADTRRKDLSDYSARVMPLYQNANRK